MEAKRHAVSCILVAGADSHEWMAGCSVGSLQAFARRPTSISINADLESFENGVVTCGTDRGAGTGVLLG